MPLVPWASCGAPAGDLGRDRSEAGIFVPWQFTTGGNALLQSPLLTRVPTKSPIPREVGARERMKGEKGGPKGWPRWHGLACCDLGCEPEQLKSIQHTTRDERSMRSLSIIPPDGWDGWAGTCGEQCIPTCCCGEAPYADWSELVFGTHLPRHSLRAPTLKAAPRTPAYTVFPENGQRALGERSPRVSRNFLSKGYCRKLPKESTGGNCASKAAEFAEQLQNLRQRETRRFASRMIRADDEPAGIGPATRDLVRGPARSASPKFNRHPEPLDITEKGQGEIVAGLNDGNELLSKNMGRKMPFKVRDRSSSPRLGGIRRYKLTM